jgi:hypothetical protein
VASLIFIVLGLASSALAIPVCGNGSCESSGFPPETADSCPADCGNGEPTPSCNDTCDNGACNPASSYNVDRDYDGVPDRTEYYLAHKFFPNIWLQTLGYDLEESFLYRNQAMPFTVTPKTFAGTQCDEAYECLEIRFGVAYHYDHGVKSCFFCPTIYDHEGDSEFYAALVRRTTAYSTAKNSSYYWQMIRDRTSAHDGEFASDSSKVGVYGSESLYCGDDWTRYATSPRTSHVTLFAAKRKHGLYHTESECDDGGLYFDSCDNNLYNMRDYKDANLLQNIGNYAYRYNFDPTMKAPDTCGSHNVWSGSSFGEAGNFKDKFLNSITWCLPSGGGGGGGGGSPNDPPIHQN